MVKENLVQLRLPEEERKKGFWMPKPPFEEDELNPWEQARRIKLKGLETPKENDQPKEPRTGKGKSRRERSFAKTQAANVDDLMNSRGFEGFRRRR